MAEIPLYQKPWFKGLLLVILLVGIYVYNLIWQGGLWVNLLGIIFDLVMLFLLFQVCVFFYAQFILPIHRLGDRRKIVSRLWLHVRKSHGPAIFVRDGRLVEHEAESEERGPGVLWLDSASAVVTTTTTAFKQVLGPGVHFIDGNERISSVISLHTQSHVIGPHKSDAPFEKLKEDADDAQKKRYAEMQARATAVRAMTRDGIEIIPNISVTFKIDAKPAGPGERGSRFGFDRQAVEKAARGEGVNPNSTSVDQRRVAWNQLPTLIAADLWREYLSKFTLDELFEARFQSLPDIPQPEQSQSGNDLPFSPMAIKSNYIARLFKRFNNSFEKRLDKLDLEMQGVFLTQPASREPSHNVKPLHESKLQTALQVIVQMMKARMTQAVVAKLDDCGRLVEGFEISDEYKKLKERGLAVSGVGVSGLRLSPAIESQMVNQWSTSWLAHAKAEHNRVERLELIYTENGREKALLNHAFTLSQAITKNNPTDIPLAVKSLLQRTEDEIKMNDRLLGRAASELRELDDLIAWTESKEL